MTLTRREFLTAFAGGILAAQGIAAHGDAPSRPIPDGFLGLSYETRLLNDPDYFSPDNRSLLELLQPLGPGVLRIGGNSSEFSLWRSEEFSGGRFLTLRDIRRFGAFVRAAGWRVIYGLNLGNGTPEEAAREAQVVAGELKDALIAFQIGNEPDLYAHNGLRSMNYGVKDYLAEWRLFWEAIIARVPQARFAGPDTASDRRWLEAFARENADRCVFLSRHHYAEGPPTSPDATIDRLLTPGHGQETLLADVRQAPIPIRVTETNSCYGGGKYGVSDTFASALWGLALMLRLAEAGAVGVNVHGGPEGAYTPIARSRRDGVCQPRPLYFALLAFARLPKGVVQSLAWAGSGNAAAFSVEASGQRALVLINPDPVESLRWTDLKRARTAKILRLTAPALDSKMGVALGGSEEMVQVQGGVAITIPAASAAVISFRPAS